MNLISTTILSTDNRRLILPNNKIWGDTINNVTTEGTQYPVQLFYWLLMILIMLLTPILKKDQ